MDWFRTSSELVRKWFREQVHRWNDDGTDDIVQKEQSVDRGSRKVIDSDLVEDNGIIDGYFEKPRRGIVEDTILENGIIIDDYTDDIERILR